MPVIKSAKKKLRQDKNRTIVRAKLETTLKDAVKKATVSPSVKTLSIATSLLDKAARQHIIHANKAARVKSRLAHLITPKTKTAEAKKTTKTKKVGKTKKSS